MWINILHNQNICCTIALPDIYQNPKMRQFDHFSKVFVLFIRLCDKPKIFLLKLDLTCVNSLPHY